MKEYLDANLEEPKGEATTVDQTHETPIHKDLNTIAGGFLGGGSSTSKRKRYARAVMSLDTKRYGRPIEPSLYFTSSNLEDVFPHEDDPVVVSVITIGRKVHRVLIHQESLIDVMFWEMFTNLQISTDQLRPCDGCFVDFAGE